MSAIEWTPFGCFCSTPKSLLWVLLFHHKVSVFATNSDLNEFNSMHQDVPTISTTTSHSSSTSDGKEHGISGAKTDEIFYPPNGTRKSSDEDLNICLSMYNLRIAE
ncbi:hypothetical protein ACSQ67_021168 [Phaseolus vulgaris]